MRQTAVVPSTAFINAAIVLPVRVHPLIAVPASSSAISGGIHVMK